MRGPKEYECRKAYLGLSVTKMFESRIDPARSDGLPIPKMAKLVFKGDTFEVYQWKQRLYDGSHATFEGIRRTYTVQVIPTVGRRIVALREEQPGVGSWNGLVGGRIDPGERPLEAAKRELLEETGLSARKWFLVKTFHPKFSQIDWKVYLYVAQRCTKVAEQHLDAGERISVRHITLRQLLGFKGERIGADIKLYLLSMKNDMGRLKGFEKKLFG